MESVRHLLNNVKVWPFHAQSLKNNSIYHCSWPLKCSLIYGLKLNVDSQAILRNTAAHPRCLSWTGVSADRRSLHKVLRKRDGNNIHGLIMQLIQINTCERIFQTSISLFVLTQLQELLLAPPSPLLPSLHQRPKSFWRSWAGPKGTSGIAVYLTYSNGLCSSCIWALMSRCVYFCSCRVWFPLQLLTPRQASPKSTTIFSEIILYDEFKRPPEQSIEKAAPHVASYPEILLSEQLEPEALVCLLLWKLTEKKGLYYL